MDDYNDVFNAPDNDLAALLSRPNTGSISGVQPGCDDPQSNQLTSTVYVIEDVSSGEHRNDSLMNLDEQPPTSDELTVDSFMDVDEVLPLSQHNQEEHHEHGYRFRSHDLRPTSVRDGKSVWITWLDTDDSGNFDPNDPEGEKRRSRLRRASAPPRRPQRSRSASVQHSREFTDKGKIEPAAAYLSRLAARQRGISITVTLDLTTLALQKLAASIPDNWPGKEHNIISDDHIRYLADQINARNGGVYTYNLRQRESNPDPSEALGLEDCEQGLWLPNDRLLDPLGEETDLRNHPVARGCKACRELQSDCSLLTDEFNWPCFTCATDDCDCELITPPTKRAACEYCKKRRLRCSYRSSDSDASLPCTECASHGFVCVAGPDPDHIRERVSYDKDYSQQPEDELMQDDRKFVACTECRRSKQQCSLKSKFDFPPCESCRGTGTGCTFEPLSRKPSKQNLRQNRQPKQVEGAANVIKTALNHPIRFLHDIDGECTWCTRSIGVFGRGWRDVEVIPSTNGRFYIEVSGGENEDGQRDDKMCINCTMDRVRIIVCPEHKLRPTPGITPNLYEQKMADMFAHIIEGAKPRSEDVWCAICPAPAFYKCCTPQEVDKFGQVITDPNSEEAQSCGLHLCENCAVSFGELGDLNSLVEVVRDNGGEIWVLGMRADAELLKNDSLLVQNVLLAESEVVVID